MTPETATTWVDLLSGGGTGVTLLLFIVAGVWLAKQTPAIIKAITANAISTEHSADALDRSTKALDRANTIIERMEAKLNV